MRSVERFYLKLVEEYGTPLSFKTICEKEGIVHTKEGLSPDVFGVYVRVSGYRAIILNSSLSFQERRDWAWHELWHHFHDSTCTMHYAIKEERAATLFAALCRIPIVKWNDSIEALVDRHSVSPWLAKARIEYEAKKLNSTQMLLGWVQQIPKG
jgi:hypothetical protein